MINNNGGGNPNHAEDGKFTSADNKAAPKAQPSPLEKLMGGLFKGAEKDLEEENRNIEAIKKMGFDNPIKDKLANLEVGSHELTGDEDDEQVIIDKKPNGTYILATASGNHISGGEPDETYESKPLTLDELIEELENNGYDKYLGD